MLVPSPSSLLLPPISPHPGVRSRAGGGSSPPQLLLAPFQGQPHSRSRSQAPWLYLDTGPQPGKPTLNLSLRPVGPGCLPTTPSCCPSLLLGERWGLCGQLGHLPPCKLACPKQPSSVAEVTGRLWHLPARSFAPLSLPAWVAAASLGCPGTDSFGTKRPRQERADDC